jgi:hypothetical protein
MFAGWKTDFAFLSLNQVAALDEDEEESDDEIDFSFM